MTITLNIPFDAVDALQDRVDKYNTGSGQPPVTITEFEQLLLNERLSQYVAAYKTAQREALIPVADAILAAPSHKQAAAITAALEALRP